MFDSKAINSLNETEAKIYRYVIDHIDDIYSLGVRELANDTFTSTATVIRMYKKLGCTSFDQFKQVLISYFHNDKFSLSSEKRSLSKMMDYFMSEEFDENILNGADFVQAADYITVFGVGNSAYIAGYGARYLSNVGCYAMAVTDMKYPPMLISNERHLIIVVSESGESKDLINQLKFYKNGKSKILVITAAAHSTVATYGDLVIHYEAEKLVLPQTYSLTSEMAVVYIFERMGRELFKRDKRILKTTPPIT